MSSNNERLKVVAEGLGELNSRVVFVGGCVAQLYVTDPAAADVRPTDDVDCVVDLSSYSDYNMFSELLRGRRFRNSTRPGDPLCRWTFQDEIVDIMPYEDSPIGPSNRWYKPGMRHRVVYEVSQGVMIQVLPVVYYVATKLEAILSRGGDDLRISHDFEDIIYILHFSSEFESQFASTEDLKLKSFLKEQFSMLLKRPFITEEILSALPYGEGGDVTKILSVMKSITNDC